MGGKPSPFGIDEESLDEVLDEILKLSNTDIRGVHLFTGTQILDHNILIKQYRKAIEIAEHVAGRITGTLESIDFGGGLGIPYFERESQLDLKQFAPLFGDLIVEIGTNPMLYGLQPPAKSGRQRVAVSSRGRAKRIGISRSAVHDTMAGGSVSLTHFSSWRHALPVHPITHEARLCPQAVPKPRAL